MALKHIHVVLNFLVLLACNFFVFIPVLSYTIFKTDPSGNRIVISLLLSIAYLMLYQIEMSKSHGKGKARGSENDDNILQ